MDFAKARELMVEQQVRPWDVLDARILHVMGTLPREAFIPAAQRNLAYADTALPLADGRVAHKPVFEGRTLQSVLVRPNESVLEIGTGSGYVTACLARLGQQVTSLETSATLAANAREQIAAQGLSNVEILDGNAFNLTALNGRQFDVVVVNGAMAELPSDLMAALKDGGRLFYVRGEAPAMEAVVVQRQGAGYKTQVMFETDIAYLEGAEPKATFSI